MRENIRTKYSFKDEAAYRYCELAANIGHPLKECYEKTHAGSGVIISAITPIVDMFSSCDHVKRREILKQIGIIYPEVFWNSLRHGLIHHSKQSQCIMIKGAQSGIMMSYNWDQNDVTMCKMGNYSINPKLLYEHTLEWLKTCMERPPYDEFEYTYMKTVTKDTSDELYKELEEILKNS